MPANAADNVVVSTGPNAVPPLAPGGVENVPIVTVLDYMRDNFAILETCETHASSRGGLVRSMLEELEELYNSGYQVPTRRSSVTARQSHLDGQPLDDFFAALVGLKEHATKWGSYSPTKKRFSYSKTQGVPLKRKYQKLFDADLQQLTAAFESLSNIATQHDTEGSSLSSRLRQFDSVIPSGVRNDARAATSGTRAWLLAELRAWRDTTGQRFCVLVAPSGFGKTTTLALLAVSEPGHNAALHFCRYYEAARVDPLRLVRSIAQQIASKVPIYQAELARLSEEQDFFRERVVRSSTIPLDVLFQDLIAEPLQACVGATLSVPGVAASQRLTVIIDGLDELVEKDMLALLAVLRDNASVLPENLGFVFSMRDSVFATLDESFKDPATVRVIDAADHEDECLADASTYLRSEVLGKSSRVSETVANLASKSEASFLYLRIVAARYRQLMAAKPASPKKRGAAPALSEAELASLAFPSIQEALAEQLAIAKAAVGASTVRRVLHALIATPAKQHPEKELPAFCGLSPEATADALAALDVFVVIQGRTPLTYVTFVHKSIVAWLTAEDEFKGTRPKYRRTDAHLQLAGACCSLLVQPNEALGFAPGTAYCASDRAAQARALPFAQRAEVKMDSGEASVVKYAYAYVVHHFLAAAVADSGAARTTYTDAALGIWCSLAVLERTRFIFSKHFLVYKLKELARIRDLAPAVYLRPLLLLKEAMHLAEPAIAAHGSGANLAEQIWSRLSPWFLGGETGEGPLSLGSGVEGEGQGCVRRLVADCGLRRKLPSQGCNIRAWGAPLVQGPGLGAILEDVSVSSKRVLGSVVCATKGDEEPLLAPRPPTVALLAEGGEVTLLTDGVATARFAAPPSARCISSWAAGEGRETFAVGTWSGEVFLATVALEDASGPLEPDTATFRAHTASIQTIAALSGEAGTFVVTGALDEKVSVHTAAGEPAGELLGHKGSVTALCTHTRNIGGAELVVSGARDGTVRVWAAPWNGGDDAGACLGVLKGHDGAVTALVAFAAGGSCDVVASGSWDTDVLLWDVTEAATGTVAPMSRLKYHALPVSSLSFWRSVYGEARLASGSWDGSVRVWDLVDDQDKGRESVIQGASIWVNPADPVRAAGGAGRPVASIAAYALSSGDEHVLTADNGGNVRRLSAIASDAAEEVSRTSGFAKDLRTLCITRSPVEDDDISERESASVKPPTPLNFVVTAARSPEVAFWPLGETDPVALTKPAAVQTPGHNGFVSSLCAFEVQLTTGEVTSQLATGSDDCTIRLWNLKFPEEVKVLRGHTKWITTVHAFKTNRGRPYLASGSYDHKVRIWDVQTGECLQELVGHKGWISCLETYQDAQGTVVLVTGAVDATIHVWKIKDPKDLEDGEENIATDADTFKGHTGWVTSLATYVDKNGARKLASGSLDETVRIWDMSGIDFPLDAGQCIATLRGHTGDVTSIRSFMSALGGPRLVTGSADSTIKVWEPEKGVLLGTYVLDDAIGDLCIVQEGAGALQVDVEEESEMHASPKPVLDAEPGETVVALLFRHAQAPAYLSITA